MTDKLTNISERILDLACKKGADAADVVTSIDSSINIEVLEGELEHAESSDHLSVGLRVLVGSRQACVAGSDVRKLALADMAERAIAMAREAPEDPYTGLAEPEQLAVDTDTAELKTFEGADRPSPEMLEEQARRIESSARSTEGVTNIETASTGFGEIQTRLLSSNGFSASRLGSFRYAACSAVAGEGLDMETDYYVERRIFADDMSSAEEVGRIAGERAVERCGSTRPRTGSTPIIFDERVASSLVGHLLETINGSAVARGSSWLLNAIGTQVLPSNMHIVEEPHRVKSLASRKFDVEGLPTADRHIVQDGTLMTWILDLATGRQLGMDSTANASRGASSIPRPSVSNISITEGESSREQLMKDMGTGLVITSLIGSTINPNTGDYSRGASGFRVENGEPSGPVSEFTIAGNLKEMLRSLVPANDARPFKSFKVPSLLVEGITVAGD